MSLRQALSKLLPSHEVLDVKSLEGQASPEFAPGTGHEVLEATTGGPELRPPLSYLISYLVSALYNDLTVGPWHHLSSTFLSWFKHAMERVVQSIAAHSSSVKALSTVSSMRWPLVRKATLFP